MSFSSATRLLSPLLLIALPVSAALRTQRVLSLPAMPWQQVSNLTADGEGNLIFSANVFAPSGNPAAGYSLVEKADSSGRALFTLNFAQVSQIALAVDSAGDIYVAGPCIPSVPYTSVTPTSSLSNDTTGSCLAKLHGQDGRVVYQVFMPEVDARKIAISAAGQILLTGSTGFTPFFRSTPGAFSSPGGGSLNLQMCLLAFSSSGELMFAGNFGGQVQPCEGSQCPSAGGTTLGEAVIPDAQGNIWVVGNTNTIDTPVTPDALQSKCGCSFFGGNLSLAKFSQDGSRLLYSTFLGPPVPAANLYNSETTAATSSAAMDGEGHIWITGDVIGPNFPVTANAAQLQNSANGNGFVTEYDPTGNCLLYSTYFGSISAPSWSIGPLTIAPGGNVFLTGALLTNLPGTASGYTRGSEFLTSIDPATYAITSTFLPAGAVGAGLVAASDGSVTVAGPGNIVEVVSGANAAAPEISAVANSGALELTSQISPGELISIYGSNLGPTQPVAAGLSQGQAPLRLGGVQVLINGAPVPLLYAQGDQINAIVPFGISTSGSATIEVSNAGGNSNPAQLNTAVAAPSAFILNQKGWAVALNEDGTINSAKNHAKLGTRVTVFATGFGQLNPAPSDGAIITTPVPALVQSVQVTGAQPNSTTAGSVPGLVAGVMQVSFLLPASATSSELAFQLTAGGWPAQDSFVVLVKE